MATDNAMTILIATYDAFNDCWGPMSYSIKRYWPDCPYPVLMMTNHLDADDGPVKTMKIGDDLGWCRNLLVGLDKIETPYVMLLLEDFWLTKRVDTQVIEEYVEHMKSGAANYIRLYPVPPAFKRFSGDTRLGVLGEDDYPRTSLQAAIWNVDVLRNITVPEESPWQFEQVGHARSFKYGDTFLSVKEFYDRGFKPFHYGLDYLSTAVDRGKWTKGAIAYARRENLDIDFSNRPHETYKNYLGRIRNFARERLSRMLKYSYAEMKDKG